MKLHHYMKRIHFMWNLCEKDLFYDDQEYFVLSDFSRHCFKIVIISLTHFWLPNKKYLYN